MTKLKALFLGAGKRLSLLEYFQDAAAKENVDLELYSIEASREVPIGKIARVFIGPKFSSDDFKKFLLELHRLHQFDMIIPNMDSATVALSSLREELNQIVPNSAKVSSQSLCVAMEDKILADDYFKATKVLTPQRDKYPAVAKSRLGFGAKDQAQVSSPERLNAWLNGRSQSEYIVQEFISGVEYTVDAFVDQNRVILGVLSRRRLQVSDGEVEVSRSEFVPEIIDATRNVLSRGDWYGPITLQFIVEAGTKVPFLIEINPRFGGGVTHSLHLGLDMPRWLIRETLRRENQPVSEWEQGSIMTRCRRDVFYDNIH